MLLKLIFIPEHEIHLSYKDALKDYIMISVTSA